MKKLLFILLACTFLLVGCGVKEEEFNGGGVTVILESDFKEYKSETWDYYLENDEMAFMTKRTNKLSKIGEIELSKLNLSDYMKMILATNKLDVPYYKVDGMNGTFYYAFYRTYANEEYKYTYMTMVIQSDDYFYNINLSCDYSNYDNCRQDFLKYAVTIRVE